MNGFKDIRWRQRATNLGKSYKFLSKYMEINPTQIRNNKNRYDIINIGTIWIIREVIVDMFNDIALMDKDKLTEIFAYINERLSENQLQLEITVYNDYGV